MQPATTRRCARPLVLWRDISRIAFTDSCLAVSMNEQVFTTMTSASSARGVISAPPWASRPIMTSLSTRFFGQPKDTNPTLVGFALGAATGWSLTGIESSYCTVGLPVTRGPRTLIRGLDTVFFAEEALQRTGQD